MKVSVINKLILIVAISTLPLWGFGQNCSSFISYNTPQYPYKYNGQSKSATCQTGRTYKFIVTLLKGNEYKLSFYASSVFDNKINFKIIDESTGDVVLERPGQSEDISKKGSVLVAPMDMETAEMGDYPSFDFHPLNSMKLQIEIDVLTAQTEQGVEETRRGCVGVLIQEKKATSNEGF